VRPSPIQREHGDVGDPIDAHDAGQGLAPPWQRDRDRRLHVDTTWWLVTMCPCLSRKKPEPLLPPSAVAPETATVARSTRPVRPAISSLNRESRPPRAPG